MLVKGQIPSYEPVVSIGLVLPEDHVQKLVIMDVENNRSFNINLSKEPRFFPTSTYKLSSIRAGRGFHWEKNISITVESFGAEAPEGKVHHTDGLHCPVASTPAAMRRFPAPCAAAPTPRAAASLHASLPPRNAPLPARYAPHPPRHATLMRRCLCAMRR